MDLFSYCFAPLKGNSINRFLTNQKSLALSKKLLCNTDITCLAELPVNQFFQDFVVRSPIFLFLDVGITFRKNRELYVNRPMLWQNNSYSKRPKLWTHSSKLWKQSIDQGCG